MRMSLIPDVVQSLLELLAILLIVVLGIALLFLLITFIYDKLQRKDAILKNYPVVGHMRYIFTKMGEFFRQYFFAMDRAELPFNRAERDWVYHSSKNEDTTVAFGSTRYLKEPGTIFFINCPYPTLETEHQEARILTIGEDCKYPYQPQSIFNISGMSFGALSIPAVTALSKGAKMAGCWMNTGEGGLSDYHLQGGCDIIFQIGTAKYGIRSPDGKIDDEKLKSVAEYPQVKMFELKLSQGAKPGKGGILPAEKVTPTIAKIRGIPEGESSISPNRHLEINSNDELLDFIAHVRRVTGKPVGFKTVVGSLAWFEDLMEKIKSRGAASAPDFITIDSADGGTGAAPKPLIDYLGLPIKESLPLVRDIILKHKLRDRIKIIASGKLLTPSMVAWALCAGADYIVSARGFMFSLGCIQALKCNKNTCPTGITTHDPRFQRGLDPTDKAVRVANYCKNMVKEVESIAHSCGVPEPRRLRRFHVRILQNNGLTSLPMYELFPTDDPTDRSAALAKKAAEEKLKTANKIKKTDKK